MPNRGWDEASHMALLLAFIDEIKPGKQVITGVTQRMKEKGWSYSYDAIKYLNLEISLIPSHMSARADQPL